MSNALLTIEQFATLTGDEFTAGIASDPELANEVLDAAGAAVGELWGSIRSTGHMARTAHMLTVLGKSATGSEGGPVTARSISGLSISYAATSFDASEAALSSTKWGRMYLDLKKSVLVVPMVDVGILIG